MPVIGFSHVTINVRDLTESLRFYADLLGMTLVHRGEHDVYLEWGVAWVCLQEKAWPIHRRQLGVDHIAFHVDEHDFPNAVAQLHEAAVPIVRGPIQRGAGWSINFLDPDGTELELHTSTLAERIRLWS